MMYRLSLFTLLLIGIAACNSTKGGKPTDMDSPADTLHTSQNSLTWAGTYVGALPFEDCPGIHITLSLYAAGQYYLTHQYLGESDSQFTQPGSIRWQPDGISIALSGTPTTIWQVREGALRLLDSSGQAIRIDSGVVELQQQSPLPLHRSQWVVISLSGIDSLPAIARPTLSIDSTWWVNGSTGCNRYFGNLQIQTHQRLQFTPVGVTEMYCQGIMAIEQQWLAVLDQTDRFQINRDTLRLYHAKRIPLATLIPVKQE